MLTMIQRLCIPVVILAFLYACDTNLDGNLNENLPPRTFLTVESIDLDDANRLSSRVEVTWWGDDPDGFVEGFEFAINDTSAGNWTFTEKTDSLFIMPISPGEPVDDVLFAVRAIDNEGSTDPNPASVVFPIRNSPPETTLNPLELPPDTTFSTVSFGWSFNDSDGLPTILRTEIAFNDTANGWIEIPIESEDQEKAFISLEINDTGQPVADAEIFLGRSYRPSSIIAENILINEQNKLFVRTVDRALAVSEVQEVEWFVKRQTSNILFLNDHADFNSDEVVSLHLDLLQEAGFTLDIIDISDGSGLQGGVVPLSEAFPRVINPTLNKTLAKWDFIYWVSNDLSRNINFGQEILTEFFENGGKLFTNIPVRRLSSENQLINFLAIQQFVPLDAEQAERSFQIREGSNVTPLLSGPDLVYRGNISNIRTPFEVVGGALELYEAEFRKTFFGPISSVPHEGPSNIAVQNPEGNVIYFGLGFENFTAPEGSDPEVAAEARQRLEELTQEFLINRLGFQQN